MRYLLSLGLILCLATVARTAPAQDDFGGFGSAFGEFGTEQTIPGLPVDEPITLEAQFTTATDERPAVLMLTAELAPGWHTFSLTQEPGGPARTVISLAESPDYKTIGRFDSHPRPEAHISQVWTSLRVEEHANQVTWYVPIELAEGVSADELVIKGVVDLQVCEDACIPKKLPFEARVGEGVPIGRVRVNTRAAPPKVAHVKPDALRAPPSEAGVLKVEDSVVTWYGWVDNGTVKPGERAYLQLRAEMPEKWHINAYAQQDSEVGPKPTLMALDADPSVSWYRPDAAKAPVEQPPPRGLESWGTQRYHEGPAVWTVPIDVGADAEPGPLTIKGMLGYHACEGLDRCEATPIGIAFEATLHVGESTEADPAPVKFSQASYKAVAELASSVKPSASDAPAFTLGNLEIIEFGGKASTSLPYILLAALAGGLILNLMPCVLPVIGLKVMSFARQGGESRARVFSLNLSYVLGLLFIFMLLATLASLPQIFTTSGEGLNWGELNTFTSFKVGMTVLVFAMALSFLGVWEIPIPGFVGGAKASELASREGHGGAFFKGMLTTILATPCSGPFLGPVFTFTMGQEIAVTYLVFLFIGLGMALPYLIIGVNPRLVQWIPKPGAWMDTFKQFMGFVLLATVVYLFSTINPEFYIETLALCVAVWFACWLGGGQALTAPLTRRIAGWVTGAGVATAVGYIAFGPPLLPQHPLDWRTFSPAAVAEAQSEGRTVLLDFTANWCLTCQVNLHRALDVAAVKEVVEANDVAAIKADWTDYDPEIKSMLESLKSGSIPLLAIFPADRPNEVILLRDVVTQRQVLQALAQAGADEGNPERGYAQEVKPVPGAVARN